MIEVHLPWKGHNDACKCGEKIFSESNFFLQRTLKAITVKPVSFIYFVKQAPVLNTTYLHPFGWLFNTGFTYMFKILGKVPN